MRWLTDNAWEQRIRRTLHRHGNMQLHKIRGNGGYFVCDVYGNTKWYANLDKLQDLCEWLEDR